MWKVEGHDCQEQKALLSIGAEDSRQAELQDEGG
jgi:hypothetical protein